MNAAIVILILSCIALAVVTPPFIIRVGFRVLEWLISVVQHEMVMRPKERYYRM